ncbi:acyl-CoA thioesterase [Sphingomonas jejuensis]|uniref:Acyl-CoA thioesterase n=1 Tax=Sphingomonas jejuensis TaxID=904715 RepID=A0ABX0XII3_9SPHN|nr:thioesterase family protein [Sphingomonas jejuensis]NJC33153.1 acyl-CoA thioesterase [Sphingomonas jejuensis]
MSLPAILDALIDDGGVLHAAIPDGWRQGRTAYGGLTAALALAAVRHRAGALPPLRSAQIAFAGPVEAEATVVAGLLRRGRTAAFWGADVTGAKGFGTRATFVFMDAQPSHIDHRAAPFTPSRRPGDAPTFAFPPAFAQNFDYRFAEQRPDTPRADIACWVRLKDRAGIDPQVELLCIGDALPPAAIMLASTVGPLSSLTWQLNFNTPDPQTDDGWWLLRSTSDHAEGGITTQHMGIWNAAGDPVLSATQTIALFF